MIINLAETKKKKQADQYKRLVLGAFDDLEHSDKRQVLDRKADVQIKAREQL